MRKSDRLFFDAYRRALILYSSGFRRQYGEQMMLTLSDACGERRANMIRFWLKTFADLAKSACVERILIKRQPIFTYAFSLAMILTLLGGAAALTIQQMLRRGADQPQIEMVDWYASEIESGEKPSEAIPTGYVDLERSLQPFNIFYDDRGKPEEGTGYLNQLVPTPPSGVFEYVRSHGSEKFTWQPSRDVRIAAVIRRVTGAHPGFMLSGRSLRLVEEEESLLRRMAILGWVAVVLILVMGTAFLQRAQAKRHATSAV
jgi:hypothetical protein